MCVFVCAHMLMCVCGICKYTLSYHKVLGNYGWKSIFLSTLNISSGTGDYFIWDYQGFAVFLNAFNVYIYKIYYSLIFTKPAIRFYLTLCFICQRLSVYNVSGLLFLIENSCIILIIVSFPQFPRFSSISSPIRFNTFIIFF